jgi:hypothetical protein
MPQNSLSSKQNAGVEEFNWKRGNQKLASSNDVKYAKLEQNHELHCALKTGYTVTSLSINNLPGYTSVTHQLHGYILAHQQLAQQQT